MKKKLFSSLLILTMALTLLPCGALAAASGAAPQGNAVEFNGHSYLLVEEEMTWVQAQDYAESLGGYLACITSAEEQAFVNSLLQNGTKDSYWLGATDEAEEGVWTWVSGEPFVYSNWASRQPDNYYRGGAENYLGIARVNTSWGEAGRWNDFNTGTVPGLIIEWGQVSGMAPPTDSSKGTSAYGGHSYLRIEEGMTWTQARDYAESLGGYLVCITSEEEQTFVDSLLHNGTMSYYWLGATDEAQEGTWTWLSGEPFQYSNWGGGQPDNDYSGGEDYMGIARVGEDWANPGEWNDYANSGSISGLGGFIVEWPYLSTSFGSSVSDWATPEMEKAYRLDLIPDSLIGEDLTKDINRAEFAAVAVKTYEALNGTKALPAVENPFTDCNDVEVLKAYNIGAVNGTGPATFTPDKLLDRQEAATMLTRVFKRVTLPGWTLDTDSQFKLSYTMPAPFADDGDISSWARDSVYFMAANGIIKGNPGNLFAPRNVTSAQEAAGYANATREQALAIAVRMAENLK